MASNNNDWRSRVKGMMTDPDYAEKMASAIDTTRKVNTNLMNKSEENYPSLSLTQPTQKPLDLSRAEDIKAEEMARATMPTDGEEYSGVADLATRLYAEERDKRGKEAMQRIADDKSAAFASPMATAINRVAEIDKATNIGQTYDAVMKNEALIGAVRANANKALVKALEENQSMTEEEQQKVYEDAVKKQMEGIESKVNEYLLSVNAPKSEAEYIAKSAINNSIIGKAVQGAARAVAGDGGEFGYEQQALDDYDKNKATWWGQGLGVAAGLALDAPIMQGIGMGVNATIGRGTMWGLSRVGGKALQNSLLGKVAMGMTTGGGVLGGYNAVSTLQSQLMGGYFNPSEIASSAGHGALLGGLTGGMTPWLRGMSANMSKVGKVGTMAGGLATEAGIFTASELSEMDNPYDIETIAKAFGKNVAVIGGLKVSNLPKTISEYKGWYNEGKQSNFTDTDYKVMADFAKENGYANEDAFTMNTDGTYKRSIADRVTGNRTLLEMTKLQGGKEHRLAIDMFSDPNVPLSLKTKIAAKMGWQAPTPVLANGVRVEGNKAITYYTLPDGRQQVIDIKEFKRPRNARAFANEFGRTTARRNDLLQSEAFANEMASEPIILARLNEQAKRNGTSLEEETARLDAIRQRYNNGTITKEDVAYYNSIYEGDATATDAIKETIKAEQGVDIDEVLRKEGSFTDAEDKALTAYSNALRDIIEKGNPTTERMAVASTAGVADYVVLNNLDIMQTTELMANPTKRAEVDAQMRGKYAAWLKYFDGKMGEDALAERLGYNLDSTSDLQSFLAEQTYFKAKAADRIASRTVETAKAMLEQGGRGVRFTEGGKVKLQGVPYPVEVSQEIVDRYDAAMQGSGEPMSRIVNDALKDIIKQGETPVAPKEPIAEEAPGAEEPMSENEVITQQMVDVRLAEIDTDLQGIQVDGIQRMTINGRPVAIIKGRIVADADGKVDKTKSSTEVAYMLLDENGRPILEDGKPKIEVGVKPSNVRVEDIEQWRSVDDYKAAEEQRIRENNRLTDEAMQMADEEMHTEEMPAESKAAEITDPQTTDELLTLCKGDRELALDVAMDELNRAQQSKGKGANAAETMAINQRIRTYQRMVDDLSKAEEPTPTEAPTEQTTDTQVTDDMEFIYQKDLGENHDGMEPMQLADGRYKWVGLQRGELTATMGERDAELLDGLAKKLGVAVIPIDVADSAVNGYYRDGNIYVNTNRGAEWTMRWVAGHEMLHDVAKKSPEAYDAYKQAVLNMWDASYIDSQVKQIIDDYAASGKTIDREQALTELVNDFGGELFNSRDGLNILDNILKGESRKGNTGFVETIKQWWEKLKEWFGATPYYNEAQKMLEKAYKDAMENVDYQAKQEQVVKDMDDAFFGETNVTTQKSASVELAETKDYTPTKMPRGVVVGNKESKDYSVKQIMRGVGIEAQTDGDNVWFERDGKKFDKYNPMTIEEGKSGILKDMVDQCMELGLMDEAKAEDVYKMYTGIVNKIIEKADGSFADLNNQYLWLGESVYKVVHSNSDKQYKRSLDITLVCKKNEAVIRGISELQRRQGFGVTPSQIMQLYYSTLDKGFQVPCPVCYVFSRYIQNGQYISNLIYGHHKFDKDKYFKNPSQMSAKKKAEAEQYWLEKYNEAVAWEEANAKLIADAKSVLSWATKEMDMLMLDAAKGNLDKAKRNEYKERAKKLDAWYRAALDLVAQSDMSGYIKSVIANPIVKDKKVVGMAMREDAGQKMTQEVEEAILDYRKVALAKTKYPHISRYIASKGSAAGKGFNFEGDNPMGDILQQLSTNSKNYFQEAMNATSEKERKKLMKSAKDRTMAAAKYAAQQSLRGGVRQWSWSDNIEALAPDVALNAMQVGMLGGAMQTYSKQLEGIEMMAAMGAYVNGSLMGKGMGYQKVSENYSESPKWQDPNTGSWYTLAFDDVVGVQPRSLNGKLGLFALNQMYDKAGNILVGMNDIHIRTAMADPRIFFIIPWHASGMSDHILKQMNSMLKLDIAGFKASDYTKHQEEKMYKEKKETDKAEEGEEEDSNNVTESTTALWRSHDYSDRFVNNDGTKANIAIEDGTLSADQLHYRELRDAIFMHSNAESAGSKDKAFWAEHQDWLAEIKNDIFLNQAYESVTNGPGRFGIAMTTDDCGFIYPYEYWDKASTFDNADINGQRYVEYCRRLGVKPKFSGVDSGSASEYGNFVDDAGYWKLLIDRRMYDRNGNFQDLTPVDASGFNADFVDQDKTSARFPVTVVADKEQTSTIVDDVQYNELKTYRKKKLEVDYKALPETAVKKAAEALMEYNQAKQLVSMTKTGKRSVKIQKELYELELGRLADEEALADIVNDNFMDNEGAEMSIVRDRNKIDELEGEELVPMLRTFQVFDGRLYPPMAAVQSGKKVHSVMIGDWWQSEENPGEAKVKVSGTKDEVYDKEDDRISKKDGRWVITINGEDKPLSMEGSNLAYYFKLKKGEKGDFASDELYARYNPYVHASKSALNDQFKGAYLRPNLMLVEVLVPKSELDGTNRYKADYAKDGIGFVPWNSGDVIKQAVAAGHPGREVALSRYAKIGRVFTNAEWADHIDAELAPYKDKVVLPFVMFPPEVLRGLANKGYKIEPPTSKKAQPYYEKWLKGEQPTDPNGGGGKPIDAEFSVKADKELEKKSLVGVHNLTEDNLRYALNLGGLANPSTAVIDKNIMGLEGFGDISLIMPKSLVAKSTGKNAGTFAGDGYTPRFPKGDVVKHITKEGEKAIMADYPGDDKFSKDFREAWQNYGNEYGGITPALYYMYKLENGGAKIVKAEAPKIKSKEHQRIIDKFGNKEWYELNDAEKQELVDYRKYEMIESLKGADKNMVDKVVNDFINSADPEDLAYKKLRMLKMDYKEQQRAGEVDYMATYRNAQDDVALAGEQAKFNKWLADKSKRYGIEDRIFRGYTASGNRKYAPMTLANISKVMKEQGRAGAEIFMTKSPYSLRGKMLPVYKTLEQIKKNKNKLADTETYEKFRKEIGDEYNELILDISELPNVKYDDTHYILEDALLKGFDYAEKQAGIQISDAVRERISAFGNLLKEAPVKYFETKFERPVMFDEFVAAVVPKDINPELRKALADKGLAIEEYERGSEESRLEAVRRASDRDDVQFSVKRRNDEQADAKKRALETVSVTSKEAHQPTVVSSADGTKVLKELDKTKEKYDKVSNRINSFIGDVAKALGAQRHNSKSEYATFETKNGKIITIRLADHNAKVSNFDNHGELDGISIVVTPKKNNGLTNDGNAHVVEYYYDAIKLRRTEGKPLADIVRSIKQVLYSGEFKDITGLAERQEVNTDEGMFAPVEFSVKGKRADESVLDYAKRVSEEGASSTIEDADYSIVRNGKEYKNDGYTQRGNINLSKRANEAIEDGMTDIGKDNAFGRFIEENGLGEYDGEYHHVGQKFNTHYFARLNEGVTLASARKAYKEYLKQKGDREIAKVLEEYPDAIPLDGGIYNDYANVAYAGGKFWYVPVDNNADYSIKRGGKTLEERLNSKRMQTRLNSAKELGKDYPEVDNILNDLEPSDINEVVAATLGSPDFKLRWEDKTGSKGLQKHLGLSDAEKKGFRSMISSNGYTPEEAAHQIWRGLSEEIAGKTDTSEILDLVLDYARSYTKRELREMIVNNRIDTAIDYARKQAEWDAVQEQIYLEGLTEAERNAYLANKAEQEKIANMTEKQKANYFAELQRKQMLDAMTPEERAEYEAKEKWRKENAGAITSSFFAERRADKADKIQALKDEINKLIRDTRAVNDENKAKVKEIAKKMRDFINESIPAKNQDDMTNIQFNQVLAQLANATTRKDLEKPMRMVDYIGANVNRRALTRQMEDFLKKGFKGMTPKGLVKAKMVDGATSRILGLTKSLYSAMSKKPLGSELRALQTNVRGIKAELEEYNEKNSRQFQEYVDQIDAILKKSGVDRHEEMVKYYTELLTKENTGEVVDYVERLLPELFNIELVKEQRTEAKINSALNTKEDLEQLKNSLADKEEKGILSEEDKAVMDNISLYELMIDLHQRQLDIDGPGASSIASQMAAKVEQVKDYRKRLENVEEGSKLEAKLKTLIKQTQAEIDELFAQRTQAQKEVNTNTEELLANLKELRDDGISKLQEWSKAKKEREKQIVTMANESFGEDARGYWSEVDRKGKGKRDFVNWLKNQKLAFLMSPAMSFEYMLGVMDPRYYTNESPIYRQFIKGSEGLIKANDNYFVGLESYNQGINEAVDKFIGRTAMTNLKDYFKKGDRYATAIIPFAFEVTENKDGEIVKTLVPTTKEMTRGQAAKIYAWSRMADGMAKLKAHGVTDDTMEKVMEFVGEDYMNFIDWVEDVYFPKLRREKYNPIYKQMYGISMAENEHYFPFLIYQKDVRKEQELEQPSNDKLGGGVVGNLVERTRNNARLDFTAESPDIFDMITEYGKKMEEWAAYAQVREDLKKVVNNKQFKQHCDMLGTHYYKYFLEAAQVASRLYNPQPSAPNFQKAASKAQKVFASAAISLRVSTALKQLLSAPAFVTYSLDPAFQHELIKTVEPVDVESAIKGLRELADGNKAAAKKLLLNENWVGHYNWCVENLPSFRERVAKQGAGNPILEERGFSRFSDDIQAVGMLPNRLVDAFTCSVGAKAIYEYTYKKFKKNYDDKTAHNMAVTEAEIAFNTSQQSSNPVFLAPMQASKEFWVRGMMNYKNSPIGFYRNGMKANIDLYRATKALIGQPKFVINGEEKGFESGGKKAISKAAEAAAKSMMFNFFLNGIWNFGTIGVAGLSYKLLGNSNDNGSNPLYTDEEIKKVTGDNMALYLTGCAIQGMPWFAGLYAAAQTGQDYSPSILFSEMNDYADQISKDGFMSMATAQLATGLLLKTGAGIDPEVWGQIYRGTQGIMADRPMRVEDFMNLIASPRSAISGVAKQKVGQYDNLEDYVNSRIESEREIDVNDKMTFDKFVTGMRRLKKSKLDGYIDEYLADKIPDYREIANKLDDAEKKEKQEQTRLLQNELSVKEYEEEKAAKRKDKEEYDSHTKDVLAKVRKAVTVIHNIYAYGDAKSAQRIADELERRIKRGYNPDGATLDERLKGVDIYDSTGTTEQRSQDGYDTLFDRAMLGGFNKTYLGNDRLD